MATRRILVSPSLLAADFARLADEIRRIEDGGADMLHLDVMDGHFVPNLTFGPPVLESIRKATKLYFDVHLMITDPDKYVEPFAKAGANGLTIHLETTPDPDALLDRIRALGCDRGLCINPDVPVERLDGKLAKVDRLLLMSVFAGFGGQKFIPESLDRLRAAKALLAANGRADAELQVDGGVTAENAAAIVAAGADCLVAGTSVFRAPDAADAIRRLKGSF